MSSESTVLSSESQELSHYRSMSATAIAALVVALLGSLALAHPAAWFVPVVGVLLSMIALGRIQRRSDSLRGRNFAMIALLISGFFASCAPAWYFGERWMLFAETREFSEEWLSAVMGGNLAKAHQATLAMRQRQPVGTLLDEYYANNESIRLDRDNRFASAPWDRVQKFKPGTKFEFDGNHSLYFDGDDCVINQRFLIHEPGIKQPYRMQVEVVRRASQDGVFWRVVGIADAKEVDARKARF